MAERSERLAMGEEGPILWRGVAAIVVTGVLLGLVYNWRGLAAAPAAGNEGERAASRGPSGWGVAWVGQSPLASLDTLTLPESGASPGAPAPSEPSAPSEPYRTTEDDPMAIPAAAAAQGLPEIPDLERPVKIDLAVLKRFFDAGAVTIVDARDPEEYSEGHIPGAVNLPYDLAATDPARLEAFDAGGKPIVTYCGGGDCELSLNLAQELVYAGHRKVLVYEGGFPEWQESGYPVALGQEG